MLLSVVLWEQSVWGWSALATGLATAASSLPPHSFVTGSAVVNMVRQVGLAIGVAAQVAVLGSPAGPAGELAAFQRGWIAIAVTALAGAATAVLLRCRPAAAAAPVTAAAARQ